MNRFAKSSELLLLFFSGLIAFSTLALIIGNDLVWDDVFLIRDAHNELSKKSVWNVLTVPFWENSTNIVAPLPSYWRPLTSLVHWLLSNISNAPWLYHLTSLIALLAAGTALFQLLRILFPKDAFSAIWAALIFVIHPLSIEVFCMAVNIADHLAIFFLLSTLTLTISYLQNNQPWIPVVIALTSMGACFSKEFGILGIGTLPLVAAAAKLCKLPLDSNDFKTKRLAYLGVSTIVPALLFLLLRHVVVSKAGVNVPTATLWASFDPTLILFSWGQVLKYTFAPIPSGAHITLLDNDIQPWILGIASMVFPIAFLSVKRLSLSIRYFSIIFWYIGLLIIVPSLLSANIRMGSILLPTRYLDVSLCAIIIASFPFFATIRRSKLFFAYPFIVVALSMLAFIRISEWKTDVSLYSAEYAFHPNSIVDMSNLCEALIRSQQYTRAEQILSEFEKRNHPLPRRNAAIRYNILSKIAINRDNDLLLATRYIQKALENNPYELTYVFRLATIRFTAGYPEEAIWVLNRALSATWHTPLQKNEIRKRLQQYRQLSQFDEVQPQAFSTDKQ